MALPARNSALDRHIEFVPNRILKAQELERVQVIQDAADDCGVGSIYRDGGTLNVKVTITGNTVRLDPLDAAQPMFVFLKNRFEQIAPAVFDFTGQATPKIFLNYTLYRVTYNGLSFTRP